MDIKSEKINKFEFIKNKKNLDPYITKSFLKLDSNNRRFDMRSSII